MLLSSGFGISVMVVLGALMLPQLASAQAFVPVRDVDLNPAFSTFSSNFNTYANDMKQALTSAPDSLRDIIAGPNPGGVARQACQTRDAVDFAFAYNDGPWKTAAASSSEAGGAAIPDAIPGAGVKIQVNDSGSIRCLLQELNGYQKTSLYVQFQSLLKKYIADAQMKQLSNQLLNQINSANLNWAKGGVQINNGGVMQSESVYVTNTNNSTYNRNDRTLTHIVNQAAAAPGDPINSLELCDPLGVATQVAKTGRSKAEDNFSYSTSLTQCSLDIPSGPFASRNDLEGYMDNPNTAAGPGSIYMLGYSVNSPQDMPLTSVSMVQELASGRIDQSEKNFRDELQGSGFQSTTKCSGNPDDPFCLPNLATNVSSPDQNRQTVTSAIESGKKQIEDSFSSDTGAATSAESLSTEANTQPDGVLGYNPTGLQNSKTTVNRFVEELYDSVLYAYFDLNGPQEEWASAALLSIYDEMAFDDTNPNVVVTEATAEEPVAY